MSKKGSVIYQQVELTTAEWAENTTVYPPSVWLFERLESGKFNMKLSDGVHTFAGLPAVMQDVAVTVKTNDGDTYILTVTTAAGSFDTPNLKGSDGTGVSVEVLDDTATEYKLKITSASGAIATPNLRGQNGTDYDDTAIREALGTLQSQVDTLVSGDASAAIESFNEIIAFLANVEDTDTLQGIIAGLNQSIADVRDAIPTSLPANGGNAETVGGHTVGTDVPANAVFTDTVYDDSAIQAEVAKAIKPANVSAVSTLTGLPVTNYSIKATVSANTAISFASTPPEGSEFMVDILSATAFTQALPNGSGWQSDEASLDVEANKVTSISIRYVHGVYVVRV